MELITFASTSNVLRVKILDSTSTTGAGKTGLTFSSTGLIISTIADNEASATVYSTTGATIETITTLGTYATPTATKCRFKEVDSTNHPGIYELQLADARYAVASAKKLLVSISGVTGTVQLDKLIELKRLDLQSANVPITSNIKKNTALANFAFSMTDSTTHAPKTAVTVTAQRSLDGGAFASCANAVTELSNGIYLINLAATDTNANVITFRFSGTASDDLLQTYITQP